jgi:hypothetical protein
MPTVPPRAWAKLGQYLRQIYALVTVSWLQFQNQVSPVQILSENLAGVVECRTSNLTAYHVFVLTRS